MSLLPLSFCAPSPPSKLPPDMSSIAVLHHTNNGPRIPLCQSVQVQCPSLGIQGSFQILAPLPVHLTCPLSPSKSRFPPSLPLVRHTYRFCSHCLPSSYVGELKTGRKKEEEGGKEEGEEEEEQKGGRKRGREESRKTAREASAVR